MFLSFIQISYSGKLREGLIQLLIVCSGDIEANPEPEIKFQFSFCSWNLNGLVVRNFIKVSLLQALVVTHDYDITCLSETFLDSSIRQFPMKMKESELKVTIFCGWMTQVTKKCRCLYAL